MRKLISILLVFIWSCERSTIPSGALATWQGGKIDQEFFDQTIEALPQSQQKKLQDSVQRHKYFDQLVEKALISQHMEAQADPQELAKFNFQSEITLAQWYQEYLLVDNAGFTTSQLLLHFEKNKARFMKDSAIANTPQDQDVFELNKKKIARDLALQTYDFTKFYDDNKKKLVVPPESQLEWIWTQDEALDLESIQKDLQSSKLTWGDSIVSKYSQDSISRAQKGKLGTISPMTRDRRIGPFMGQLRAQLFRKKLWKKGDFFLLKAKGQQALFYVKTFSSERQRSFEESKELMYSKMMPQIQVKNHKKLIDSLKVKFKVGLLEQDAEDLKTQAIEVYQSNPQNYRSKDSYLLSYAPINALQDSTTYKTLGWVKPQHSLPQGFGVVKGLDKYLKADKTGVIAQSFKTSQGKVNFRIDSTRLGRLKPFERVQKSIEVSLIQGKLEPQPDSLVLAWSKQDRKLLTGQDFNFFLERINPKVKKQYSKKDIIDHLVGLQLYSQEAQNHGFILRSKVKTKLKTFRQKYWHDYYKGPGKYQLVGLDSTSMTKLHQEYSSVVGQRNLKQSSHELSLISTIDWNSIKSAFEADTVNHSQVFKEMRFSFIKDLELGQLGQIAKDQKLQIHHDRWGKNWILDSAKVWPPKDSLTSPDLMTLKRLAAWNPQHNDLDTISYLLGQQLQEKKKYKAALLVFQSIIDKSPDSPVAHRAAFLKGYIFYEYLKKDAEAMKSFEFMLAKYPKTELSDDAEVLLKDLKSGRQHLKNLMKNLGQGKKSAKKTIK